MRFFFCVDNNFKLWIKYFLVRFNVDKTLKYNISYQHTRLPLRGAVISVTEGWLYIRYTKLATNGRPYAHVTSIHKEAVALRQVGGFILRYTKLATNGRTYTHVTSIHKAPIEGSCRIATEGWLLYNLLL